MNLLARRRVLLDYLAGALWVLPTVSVVVFLLAGAALSRVEVDQDSPWATLAFQGTADDARSLLIVVSSTMITVTGLVFALPSSPSRSPPASTRRGCCATSCATGAPSWC